METKYKRYYFENMALCGNCNGSGLRDYMDYCRCCNATGIEPYNEFASREQDKIYARIEYNNCVKELKA